MAQLKPIARRQSAFSFNASHHAKWFSEFLPCLDLHPKILFILFNLLALGICANCPRAIAACNEVPAGQTFRIRLLQPVSSYSTKRGATIRGVLIEPPRCDGEALFPEGSIVEGRMKSVHKVGLGFRHEVATLDMEFDRIRPRTGSAVAIQARVDQVDDAREKISDGVIHGIRATNTPQDHLTSRLEYVAMWSPDTFWILPIYRIAVPFLPEPEIYFPAGTDVILQLVSPVSVSLVRAPAAETLEFSSSEQMTLDAEAAGVPDRTLTLDGRAADAVNVVFLGSEEQLTEAFDAAGWFGTDPMSRRTAFHEIGAFLLVKNYPRGPMSTQLLDGSAQALSLQKGLDSLAIRDHLRIWRTSRRWLGQPAWFAASTQDVSATLSVGKLRFIHHVDGDIDVERGEDRA